MTGSPLPAHAFLRGRCPSLSHGPIALRYTHSVLPSRPASRVPVSALRRPRQVRSGRRAGRPRWDLALALLVTVAPLVHLAVLVHARLRTADLEEELVDTANATFGVPRRRPIHRLPVAAGSEAERIARALPAVHNEVSRLGGAVLSRARQIAAGDEPISELPPQLGAALDRATGPLAEILEGTRTERAELPTAVLQYVDQAAFGDLQRAGLLAALLARRDLQVGRTRAAAAWCVDSLALGRDVALAAPGLVGQMEAAAQVKTLTPACAAVVDAAPRVERAGLVAELRSLRAAIPSFGEVMRVQGIDEEIVLLGNHDDGRIASRLAPVPRALIQRPDPPNGFILRMYARDAWRPTHVTAGEMAAAAAIEDEHDRDLAIARVLARTSRWSNLIVQISTINPVRYAHRSDAMIRRLDGLVLLAAALEYRARSGTWPTDLEPLADAGLLEAAEARRLEGTALSPLAGEASGLRLRVPLPGNESEPKELDLETRGR